MNLNQIMMAMMMAMMMMMMMVMVMVMMMMVKVMVMMVVMVMMMVMAAVVLRAPSAPLPPFHSQAQPQSPEPWPPQAHPTRTPPGLLPRSFQSQARRLLLRPSCRRLQCAGF